MMITAIDTNILIDIFGADPLFGQSSAKAVRQCLQEGTIYACEIVWIETHAIFPNQNAFLQAMETLGIIYSSIHQDTALLAGKIWHNYRQKGGKRERVVADFLIGSHALLQADRLVTRDRGFYRDYFDSLTIFNPQSK